MSNNNNRLKAFVRYDGSGRAIPSSLILARFKPKVGNYQEIDAYECCNFTTTTTTTLAPGDFILAENDDRLITENDNNLIIE